MTEPGTPVQSKYGQLAVLALLTLTATFDRNLLIPIQEAVRNGLSLSDAQIGLTQGLAAALPLTLLSIPFGSLADRYPRPLLLALAGGLWVSGTFITAAATTFGGLFLGRFLVSTGFTAIMVIVIPLIADIIAPSRQGVALALIMLGQTIAASLAVSAGGPVMDLLNGPGALKLAGRTMPAMPAWRAVFLFVGAVSLAALSTVAFVREPRTNAPTAAHRPSKSQMFRSDMISLWSRRSLLVPAFCGFLFYSVGLDVLHNWIVPALMRSLRLTASTVGAAVGLVLFVPGIVSLLVSGLVTDRLYKRYGSTGFLLFSILFVSASMLTFLVPLMPNLILAMALFILSPVTQFLILLPFYRFLMTVVDDRQHALTIGIVNTIVPILALGGGTSLVPLVAHAWSGASALGMALAAVVAVAHGAAITSYIVALIALRGKPRSEPLVPMGRGAP